MYPSLAPKWGGVVYPFVLYPFLGGGGLLFFGGGGSFGFDPGAFSGRLGAIGITLMLPADDESLLPPSGRLGAIGTAFKLAPLEELSALRNSLLYSSSSESRIGSLENNLLFGGGGAFFPAAG